MRIRKQWPPPPLPPSPPDLQSSTLQPLPSSESPPLHHHHRNDVLSVDDSPNLSLRSPKENEDRRRPDLEVVAVSKTNGWICSNSDVVDEKSTYCMRLSVHQDQPIGIGQDEATVEEKRFIQINRRIGYNPSVESSAASTISSSPSHQEHWCEEDKVFPVKKRRVRFRSKARDATILMDIADRKKMTVRERRKSDKKWVGDNDVEDEEEDDIEKDSAKKRGINRGGKIMEGSRCSRMNGRGWRCCQPTLVGYSLCEHHLGKGKLRSMNSVRRRTTEAKINSTKKDDDDNGNEKGLMVVARGRKRNGFLKARSISSLLDQTEPSPPSPPTVTL
uniref:Putative WRC protein n=1 Tax=Davidia involucrata TaxID=16924 RepID=A0A5B6YZ51_DAVIN